eukprot:CAMPEP_0177697176 /NCGR_PEP_ID=MMETSP0484_2-20121128/4375_1 /TAXON_ID=354590 /ORGANISM="Rhodomonas lens, Strain RHODO" /LENGTH=241 /DNA_ID=CAMNT_0019208199 /DNA_START=382 /DNA_END=1104 /DNA_ORIENTATION=+
MSKCAKCSKQKTLLPRQPSRGGMGNGGAGGPESFKDMGGGSYQKQGSLSSPARSSGRSVAFQDTSSAMGTGASYAGGGGGGGVSEMGRMQCQTCGRQFALDRIGKHSEICRKVSSNSARRATFNSTKQRLEGVVEGGAGAGGRVKGALGRVSAGYGKAMGRGAGAAAPLPSASKSERTYTDWRAKRSEMIEGLRAARMEKTARAQGITLPQRAPAPPPAHYTQCPHCHRSFDPTVAERHIP